MFRTIFLGIAVNIAVMFLLTTILYVFGLDQIISQYLGGGYQSILAICFFWGMGGSFISLLMSKWIAKTFNRVQIIEAHGQYGELVRRVHAIARKAGLNTMPEVGIYQSPDVNAFATGPSKNNSLVAVSTGLISQMYDDEVEGVLAHEVGHIANGDMVTMTVVQGVINAFVMFFAFIISQIISNAMRGDDDDGPGLGFWSQYFMRQALMSVLGLLAYPIVAAFSRYREYRADAASAKYVGKYKMISALQALQKAYPQMAKSSQVKTSAMNISSKNSWAALFSTHPPLDKRIEALNRI